MKLAVKCTDCGHDNDIPTAMIERIEQLEQRNVNLIADKKLSEAERERMIEANKHLLVANRKLVDEGNNDPQIQERLQRLDEKNAKLIIENRSLQEDCVNLAGHNKDLSSRNQILGDCFQTIKLEHSSLKHKAISLEESGKRLHDLNEQLSAQVTMLVDRNAQLECFAMALNLVSQLIDLAEVK